MTSMTQIDQNESIDRINFIFNYTKLNLNFLF